MLRVQRSSLAISTARADLAPHVRRPMTRYHPGRRLDTTWRAQAAAGGPGALCCAATAAAW